MIEKVCEDRILLPPFHLNFYLIYLSLFSLILLELGGHVFIVFLLFYVFQTNFIFFKQLLNITLIEILVFLYSRKFIFVICFLVMTSA